MRDELSPVSQDRQRQRLAIIRIVDPHQTRMDGKARRLDYADNLPDIGVLLLCHRLLRNAIFPKEINRLTTCAQKY